jgi:hypothetical protein
MYFVMPAALWPVDDVRLDVAGLFGPGWNAQAGAEHEMVLRAALRR